MFMSIFHSVRILFRSAFLWPNIFDMNSKSYNSWFLKYLSFSDQLWGMLIWIFNVVFSKRLDWTVPKVKCAWIIKNNVVPICSQVISIPKNFLKVLAWITWTTFLICKLKKLHHQGIIWNFYLGLHWFMIKFFLM